MAYAGSLRRSSAESARRLALGARRLLATVRGVEEVHPFPGLLKVGEVNAIITKVWFENGRMIVRAESGITCSGSTDGPTVILGTDGKEILSRKMAYQGVKGAFSTWTFTVDFDLTGR